MAENTREVIVHKANIPLAKGESIRAYTAALEKAASAALRQKLNLAPDKSSVYMIEAYPTKAVFDVYKYSSGPGANDSSFRYFAMDYTRKAGGEFEFSNSTEVERVVSFEPKEGIQITKAAGPDAVETKQEEVRPEFMPGWATMNKSLWAGVL